MLKNVFVVVSIVLAIGFSVVFYGRHFRKVDVKSPTKMIPVSYGDLRTFRYHAPPKRNLTPVESNAVRVAYLRITEAYTNGTVDELRRRIDEMPGFVTNMHERLHIEMRKPLGGAFADRFLWSDQLQNFTECTDFECAIEANLLVVKFLGRTTICRGEYPAILSAYEGRTLRKLRRYRDKFMGEGRMDLVPLADRFIGEWIDHIESEYGFTRWVLWHQLDLQWGHFEEGEMTREQLLDFIRNWSAGLDSVGYTPKWIDEFRDRPDFRWKYVLPLNAQKPASRDTEGS